MSRFVRSMMALAAMTLAGCQCCACTEHWGDVVDLISSRECNMECIYHPGLDLTRIGRRDWCECGINSALCPCQCGVDCQQNCR